MRYEPMTEEQEAAQRNRLLPVGVYDFEVYEATDTTAKSSGADMIALVLTIYTPDGEKRYLTDYLVNSPKAAWKVRNAAKAMGLLDRYESGELLAVDFEGKAGRTKLRVQKGNEQFPDERNAVAEYLVEEKTALRSASARQMATTAASAIDDDIPF
jgi:hypothetical protein